MATHTWRHRHWKWLLLVGAAVATLACDGATIPVAPPKPCNPAAPESIETFKADPVTFTYGKKFKLRWTAPCGYVTLAQKGRPQFALALPSFGRLELKPGQPGYPEEVGEVVYEAANGDLAPRVQTTVTVLPGSASCPNGSCGADENCTTCPGDCGCPDSQHCAGGRCELDTVCGDKACEGGETSANCCGDCGCPDRLRCQDPPAGSCTSTCPAGQSCDDGNACTANDTCAENACQSGREVDCNDANRCTVDSCSPSDGCQHSVISCRKTCNGGTANACAACILTARPDVLPWYSNTSNASWNACAADCTSGWTKVVCNWCEHVDGGITGCADLKRLPQAQGGCKEVCDCCYESLACGTCQ